MFKQLGELKTDLSQEISPKGETGGSWKQEIKDEEMRGLFQSSCVHLELITSPNS